MPEYQSWMFPEMPPMIAELLFENDKKQLVIVGVIGKSAFPDCNKMVAFNVLDRSPSLLDHEPREGQIQFYFNPRESMLLLHFETSYDVGCVRQMLETSVAADTFGPFPTFNQRVRNRFARMLLFATHVCHIIVFVELSVYFDASLLPIFKALKLIRDKHILKFLPKLVKNSSTGAFLGKMARLCSPRFLFLFENFPDGYEKTKEAISMLEFEVEDNIYKMLRNDYIVTNSSTNSLFSIPSNKRFVYYNTDPNIREDPLLKSIAVLDIYLKTPFKEDDEDKLEDLAPYRGFGKPLKLCKPITTILSADKTFLKEREFMTLLKEHVNEALETGFCDSLNKFRTKTHFTLLTAKTWYETFKVLHKIFIENPDNPEFEANDADYKSYLENFDKIMNVENEFFSACCDIGLQKAFSMYNNPTMTHYSSTVHKKLMEEAVTLYRKYARGADTANNEAQLREMCENCWQHGKQQCEYPSLRGNPCMLPKHIVQDPAEHSSGRVFISTCNCGRTQGRREDPYTIRHANYEFYEYMANNCNLCMKVKKLQFAVFQPSINDYRAAEYDIPISKLTLHTSKEIATTSISQENESDPDISQPLTASQGGHTNLSLDSIDNIDKIEERDEDNSSDESLNELVLRVKAKEAHEEGETERSIVRQPSTTEYLPGMVHTESPAGLLPQFPSWSLVCVGSSSVYSHNTGLMEHFQSGFLSASNFLLPWDVHVRLEHSASWAAAYEKTRYRKIGDNFILKIFVGYEYECSRGHRFMMSGPDKVLRGGSGIMRDSGSKVVYNNMPLYFPCPCQSKSANVAQLMRVHVVTPKAPVNVIIDPKVRSGDYVFTLGFSSPPKLTQSAYWILRLPYVYQGDEGPITPPSEVDATNAITYGCMLPGIFGVSEMELED